MVKCTSMHSSEKIKCEKSDILLGKKICLCVTGGIAAVETVKIARELIRHGADVVPYMTKNALKFVSEDSLLFATGHRPVCTLSGLSEHLEECDAVLVAPATADVISKAACGIADDAVTTLILANLEKCIFVPTMDARMYENPILQRNINILKEHCVFISPLLEEGKLKMPSREHIAAEIMHRLRNELRGKRVLVIGGAGYEKYDNFRILTNLSTGRTAVEIAKYAYYLGAEVTLLIGLMQVPIPSFLRVERFSGIESLLKRIPEFLNYDAIIVPAALPDYRPVYRDGKIKSLNEMKKVELMENPKFLKELRKEYRGYLVGFKAESGISEEELIKIARARMDEYELDAIVANLLENVRKDETKAIIIFSDGEMERYEGPKSGLARKLVELVAEAL